MSRCVVALLLAVAACLAVVPAAGAAPAHQTRTDTTRAASSRTADAPNPPALPEQPSWTPFVDQLYEQLLHRAPDPAGLVYWGNVMGFVSAAANDPSVGASYVSSNLVHAPGFTDPLIAAAYENLFRRAAEPGALQFWSSYLQSHSLEQLWAALAGSSEFASDNPGPAREVAAAYKAVLGRAPDQGGGTFWGSFLAAGGSPGAMVIQLTQSREYAAATVADAYQQALLRTPDPSGLRYWSERLENGSSGALGVLATLAGTSESVNYGCDPTAGAACLLPYPNDLYTQADATTATGRRLALKPSWTPANAQGVHIDTRELNRSDGFSPGAAAIVQIPGLDLTKTPGVPTVDEPSLSTDPGSPILVLDTTTGKQWPVWAELDQFNNPGPNPTLFIRPAVNYLEGHTYIVVLRNLRDHSGALLSPSPIFKAYLDGTDLPGVGGFEARKPYMTKMLGLLSTHGVATADLDLAWQFTVASTANITGRLVHIRDDAFTRLGGADGLTDDAAPAFTVTSSVSPDQSGSGPTPGIARVVDGTFQVPSYLTGDGGPGSIFNTGPDGLPQFSGRTITAPFRCIIPDKALTTPGIGSVYGHGLFGSIGEVTSGPQRAMAVNYGRVYCATPEIGMSAQDVPTAGKILLDLSNFDELADRTQQGMLDELFLGRLLNSPNGFDTDKAFQNDAGQGVIAPHQVTYDGNSQGGILGGVVTTVATDWTRAVLGVTAMNFSTLMDRSTDFGPFFAFFNVGYPNRLDQVISVDLIQSEWDRSEPDGYVAHIMNDPLPNTPSHHVLLQLAYGDHQVTNWAADVEARTIGLLGGNNLEAECPPTTAARKVGEWPLWNVPCIAAYPFDGSAVVYLDSGANPPPLGNVPPPEESNTNPGPTHDPHGDPRNYPAFQHQKDVFLRHTGAAQDGLVIPACTGPCVEAPPS